MSITTPESEFSVPAPVVSVATLPRPPRGLLAARWRVVPGLLLTAGIAAAAFGLHALPGCRCLAR